MQFQKMEKPQGWAEQQAVEIRRDWITFLAKRLGIDTNVHRGAELETMLVKKMLSNAVSVEAVRVVWCGTVQQQYNSSTTPYSYEGITHS